MKSVITVLTVLFIIIGVCSMSLSQEPEEYISDCGPWVNCNHNPPNFDGTCCRICFFENLGYRDWYCAKHTNDIGFTDEERKNLKGQFLYNGTNQDVRELLIMELLPIK